ncbi:MAG TPA: DNA cytosine methyltransferase [Candidatus Lokiarchaeia archaeon]
MDWMVEMKVLNLYCGIGGNRKLWEDVEVTAVEYCKDIADVYKHFFPKDTVIVEDAHEYLIKHHKEFDFIWSSPPCQTHSVCNHFLKGQGIYRYPDMKLWQEIIFLKHFYKGKYVVENVKGYYEPFIKPQVIGRHYFWANFSIWPINIDYVQIGTMNRQASKDSQRKAIIREAQIPELTDLHGLNMTGIKLKNKRQILRNCVYPKLGLHILNESKNNSKLF